MPHPILNVAEYSEVLSEVLSRVKPGEEEQARILSVARRVVSRIRRRKGKFVDVVVAGSAARGTNLRGSSDVDVFLLYPKDVPREEMEREALEIGKSLSRSYEIRYAEHPYVTVFVDGVEVDVVPAYAIEPGEPILSATDRTPLHQRYVSERLSDEQKDEVRLLKAFLKGIGVYGAEIKTEGFSGYLCELLVIHYGSFLEVLRAASRWRPPVFIDLERHAAVRFDDPLVVVDPVDPRRNVAAPVSLNSLAVFVAAAREFLEDPSLRFFFPEDYPLDPVHLKKVMLQRKTTYLFVLSSYPAGVSP
ncbi:TPA: CCA tRNA nucleotidyltransferase, partial [Candidatus Micrarchaeota archaeon]|nr:CCA tRNA nucleotidyltransferase [Candidatus Micrarchaeota archaeon]